MPELPDVETFRRYFDSTGLHQKIEDVQTPGTGMLEGVSAGQLRENCLGRSFRETRRHGKYLFASTDKGGWLVLHFGMTGYLKYFKKDEEAPGHIRLAFIFDSGSRLVFNCRRKLGRIAWTESPEKFIRNRDLGPDPLSGGYDFESFKKALQNRSGGIKSTLMNQQVVAGIGNIYSDEILFRTGTNPRTSMNDLDDRKLKEIFDAVQEILQTAIDRQVGEKGWPDSWLISRRRKNRECPLCGGQIAMQKISGRSNYYCEKHQT